MNHQDILNLLQDQADYLLHHQSQKIPANKIHHTNGNHVEQIFAQSDRNESSINNLKKLYSTGRLANTGYVSILPVDQGIEHIAGYSFAKNIDYFDPENICKLALEGGCSAVASTVGILSLVSKKYASKIPFIVKINHNELLTYPNKHDQIIYSSVKQAYELGAIGVGATIYFGSKHSNRQIVEIAQAFEKAHELGMFTILWCYPRNTNFKTQDQDYHSSADITGQANYLGVTLKADLIKQKLPTCNYGLRDLNFGKHSNEMYELATDHPIDLVRYQVANCYLGKIGLINSGGATGQNDLQEAVKTAVINKRGGGSGLIMGRKAFSKPLKQGIEILNAVQDVYLDQEITIA